MSDEEEVVWGIIESDKDDSSIGTIESEKENSAWKELTRNQRLNEFTVRQSSLTQHSKIDLSKAEPTLAPDPDPATIPTVSAPVPAEQNTYGQVDNSITSGSTKKWATVQTSYLPRASISSTLPRSNSRIFNVADAALVTKPSPRDTDDNENDVRPVKKWGTVQTSYLPRASSSITLPRSNSKVFNITDTKSNTTPIFSKRADTQTDNDAMSQILANRNTNPNHRSEHFAEEVPSKWASVKTDYGHGRNSTPKPKTVNPRKSLFSQEPLAPIVRVEEPGFNGDTPDQGCYLRYEAERYNGTISSVWSRSKVEDALFFFTPGPHATVKTFMYSQRHEQLFEKDLKFRSDRPDRRFLFGIMEFFKMALKFDGTIKFDKHRVSQMGFKIYFITNGEDVIDLSIDTSSINNGMVELDMSVVDALALVWGKYDDLQGYKKSTTEIFIQQGNLHGNLAMSLTLPN